MASAWRAYVFAEIATPTKLLLFDVLVHRAIYPGAIPELGTYDTAFDGVVDVNDPAREVDRLDTADRLEVTGRGIDYPLYGTQIAVSFDMGAGL